MSRASTLLAAALLLAGCDNPAPPPVPGGDAERGRLLVIGYGCGTCHRIPDIPGADANVGPPLGEFWRQAYIAGVLPNQPAELVRWLMDPPAVDPRRSSIPGSTTWRRRSSTRRSSSGCSTRRRRGPSRYGPTTSRRPTLWIRSWSGAA